MERLNDEEKQGDALQEEIARSKAMSQLATTIIDNANLGLQAEKLKIDYGRNDLELPSMLEKMIKHKYTPDQKEFIKNNACGIGRILPTYLMDNLVQI